MCKYCALAKSLTLGLNLFMWYSMISSLVMIYSKYQLSFREVITMAQNEDKCGKKEAEDIVDAKYISGLAKKGNLDKWADYASRNSVDQGHIHAQSRRDLAPVKGFHEEELWADWAN